MKMPRPVGGENEGQDVWTKLVDGAIVDMQSRCARLEAEIERELASPDAASALGLARAFVRLQDLASRQCSEAADALDCVGDGVELGLARGGAARLERLVDHAQLLQTQCGRGLLRLRDALQEITQRSAQASTLRLHQALETLTGRGTSGAPEPGGDSDSTRPMTPALR